MAICKAKAKETKKEVSTKKEVKTKAVASKKEVKPAKAEAKEINYRNYHVVKRSDGKWEVKFAGGQKAIKLFATQKEAVDYSKVMAENQNGVVLVHNSKGAAKGRIKKK